MIWFKSIIFPCSQIVNFKWLQGHLLPCPFKFITGIDCPGCGFQRSLLALLQGHFAKSLSLYPATIPLFIALIYTLTGNLLKIDARKSLLIKKTIYLITGAIILISYTFKIYKLSA